MDWVGASRPLETRQLKFPFNTQVFFVSGGSGKSWRISPGAVELGSCKKSPPWAAGIGLSCGGGVGPLPFGTWNIAHRNGCLETLKQMAEWI